jgi:hypothetical protein
MEGLGAIFGGLVPTNKAKLSGFSGEPTKVGNMGDPLTKIKAKTLLPSEISTKQVLKSAKQVGEMEATLELAKNIAKHEQSVVSALEKIHDVNLSHSKFMMETDLRRRNAQAVHGKDVSRHSLNAAEAQIDLEGFQAIYDVQATKIFGQ